jgi:hypothetical protein
MIAYKNEVIGVLLLATFLVATVCLGFAASVPAVNSEAPAFTLPSQEGTRQMGRPVFLSQRFHQWLHHGGA